MPISFSFTRIADNKLLQLEEVAAEAGILYELLVSVGIKCTWTGVFDHDKFKKITETFAPNVKALMQKYIHQECTFDSWR